MSRRSWPSHAATVGRSTDSTSVGPRRGGNDADVRSERLRAGRVRRPGTRSPAPCTTRAYRETQRRWHIRWASAGSPPARCVPRRLAAAAGASRPCRRRRSIAWAGFLAMRSVSARPVEKTSQRGQGGVDRGRLRTRAELSFVLAQVAGGRLQKCCIEVLVKPGGEALHVVDVLASGAIVRSTALDKDGGPRNVLDSSLFRASPVRAERRPFYYWEPSSRRGRPVPFTRQAHARSRRAPRSRMNNSLARMRLLRSVQR